MKVQATVTTPWAGRRSQSLESLLHRDCEKKTERRRRSCLARCSGHAWGTVGHSLSVGEPGCCLAEGVRWLRSGHHRHLSPCSLRNVNKCVRSQPLRWSGPTPSCPQEATNPPLAAGRSSRTTPPPLALYRDQARTGSGSVPEGASLLDASGPAVNATLNQWQAKTYFPCPAR
jgi:hypothetical protein